MRCQIFVVTIVSLLIASSLAHAQDDSSPGVYKMEVQNQVNPTDMHPSNYEVLDNGDVLMRTMTAKKKGHDLVQYAIPENGISFSIHGWRCIADRVENGAGITCTMGRAKVILSASCDDGETEDMDKLAIGNDLSVGALVVRCNLVEKGKQDGDLDTGRDPGR